MNKYVVEHVVGDNSMELAVFTEKDAALTWAKENYKAIISNGGIVTVAQTDFDDNGKRTNPSKWRSIKSFF